MSAWTDNPKETGAYWFQLEGAEADICWIHNGQIWFVSGYGKAQPERLEDYTEYGKAFWGPIPRRHRSVELNSGGK